MPKGTKKMYTTSLDENLLKRFKVYCAMRDLYQNEVIEDMIRKLLAKDEEKEGEE